MKVCVAVVRLVIDLDDESAACDAITDILTENMQKFVPQSTLLDWEYEPSPNRGEWLCFPRLVEIPDSFSPDTGTAPEYPLKEDDHA